ncbi:sensor domain-containing diguanylate cyclase [Colwellia sp. MEBiC06753]
MQPVKNPKITATLLLFFFLGLVVIAVFIALQKIQTSTKEQIKENLQTLLLTVQEAHHVLVDQRRFALESITENAQVIGLTKALLQDYQTQKPLKESEALLRFRQFIAPILENFRDQGFFIIAPDNVSIGSMRDINLGTINLIAEQKPELLAQVFKGQPVFIPPIRSDVTVNTATLNRINTNATMFIVSPIFDEQQQVIAAMALRINPMTYFSTVTELGRFGETGETYAFDEHGMLLTESRFVAQLRKMNILKHSETSKFNIYIKDPGVDLTKNFKPNQDYDQLPLTLMAQQATQGINGLNVEGYRDYRGVKVMGAWIWNSNYQFGIATEIDVEEALKPYIETRNTIILVVLVTALLAIFMLKLLFNMQRIHQLQIMQTNAELEERVRNRTLELEQATAALGQLNNELSLLAITDELTGLYNRRHFDEMLEFEWQRCKRDKKTIAVLLLDIDYFKQYNDFYGHQAGDMCLKKVGNMFNKISIAKRPGDIIARYGGEEIVVILSDTTAEYCQKTANDICQSIRDLAIPHEKSMVRQCKVVTGSIGFAITDDLTTMRAHQLVLQADKALYSAKHSGRNRAFQYFDDGTDNVTNISDHRPT